ncbi:hypothetical protein [Roseitranquillus sediminis]|uniref:hypothetical protein n=1 Tax=Roseitranquillus sediminis TaxID=2809051 RepID=UPI001D0CABEC|nr:hypothetical protein [Roseitranquillus sediminis]MBM9594234.1 hypothetical protein [Roseitranquillus sediminis]
MVARNVLYQVGKHLQMNGEPEEKNYHRVYFPIGYAEVKWEHLETRLFELYSALASNDRFADTQAYSTLLAFKTRAEVIKRLAAYRLKDKPNRLERRKTLIERVLRLSKRRNEALHGQLAKVMDNARADAEGNRKKGLRIHNSIRESTYDTFASTKRYSHSADAILGFGNSFEACRHDLSNLIDELKIVDQSDLPL